MYVLVCVYVMHMSVQLHAEELSSMSSRAKEDLEEARALVQHELERVNEEKQNEIRLMEDYFSAQ